MRLALARLCHASDLDSSVVAPRGKDQRRYPHMIAHRAAGRCSFFVLVSLPEGCKASARLDDHEISWIHQWMRFSHFTCNHSGLGSTGDFSLSGLVVGPTVGINFQTDAFVYGAEGDFDGSWIQGGSSNAFCGTNVGFPGGQCDTKSFFISTRRARFSYAADRGAVLRHRRRRSRRCLAWHQQ